VCAEWCNLFCELSDFSKQAVTCRESHHFVLVYHWNKKRRSEEIHPGKPPVSKQEEEEEYILDKWISRTLVTNRDKSEKQSYLFERNAQHQWFNSLIYKGPRKDEAIAQYYLSSLFHLRNYRLYHGTESRDSLGIQTWIQISGFSLHNNYTRQKIWNDGWKLDNPPVGLQLFTCFWCCSAKRMWFPISL
jgi:hypothetical protein